MTSSRTHTLADGTSLPAIGFGTYPLRGDDGVAAIRGAIEAGYRFIDTAVNYRNEREVAEAVRASGVPREELWIQTKVPGRDHGDSRGSVETSLEVMGLDHLDSVLVHWPNPSQGRYVEAWRGLVEAQQAGLVRHIGVSNFTAAHLEEIIGETGVAPAINQIELHPLFPQVEMRAEDERLGVLTQSWSPLGKREAQYDSEPVQAAARAHGCTPGQVILAWHLALGAMPLPKSADPGRQRENLAAVDVALADDEVTAISALGRPDGRLFDGDPDHHEEM